MSLRAGARKTDQHARSVADMAMGFLARREHSTAEIRRKLKQKGCDAAKIDAGVLQLQADGSLSDRRFTEAYVHMRKNKGYGPARIMAELREKGIGGELIAEYIDQAADDWQTVLRQHYSRKYGDRLPADYQEKSKRIGYLQARGFKLDWIFDLFDE